VATSAEEARRLPSMTNQFRKKDDMPVCAVAGTSGHLGRFAVQQLLASGVPVPTRALGVGLMDHETEAGMA
jgi:hypothetical protein